MLKPKQRKNTAKLAAQARSPNQTKRTRQSASRNPPPRTPRATRRRLHEGERRHGAVAVRSVKNGPRVSPDARRGAPIATMAAPPGRKRHPRVSLLPTSKDQARISPWPSLRNRMPSRQNSKMRKSGRRPEPTPQEGELPEERAAGQAEGRMARKWAGWQATRNTDDTGIRKGAWAAEDPDEHRSGKGRRSGLPGPEPQGRPAS